MGGYGTPRDARRQEWEGSRTPMASGSDSRTPAWGVASRSKSAEYVCQEKLLTFQSSRLGWRRWRRSNTSVETGCIWWAHASLWCRWKPDSQPLCGRESNFLRRRQQDSSLESWCSDTLWRGLWIWGVKNTCIWRRRCMECWIEDASVRRRCGQLWRIEDAGLWRQRLLGAISQLRRANSRRRPYCTHSWCSERPNARRILGTHSCCVSPDATTRLGDRSQRSLGRRLRTHAGCDICAHAWSFVRRQGCAHASGIRQPRDTWQLGRRRGRRPAAV